MYECCNCSHGQPYNSPCWQCGSNTLSVQQQLGNQSANDFVAGCLLIPVAAIVAVYAISQWLQVSPDAVLTATLFLGLLWVAAKWESTRRAKSQSQAAESFTQIAVGNLPPGSTAPTWFTFWIQRFLIKRHLNRPGLPAHLRDLALRKYIRLHHHRRIAQYSIG